MCYVQLQKCDISMKSYPVFVAWQDILSFLIDLRWCEYRMVGCLSNLTHKPEINLRVKLTGRAFLRDGRKFYRIEYQGWGKLMNWSKITYVESYRVKIRVGLSDSKV